MKKMRKSRSRSLPPPIRFGGIDTPIGRIHVAMTRRGVCRISFRTGSDRAFRRLLAREFARPAIPGGGEVDAILGEIREYFDADRSRFTCRIDLAGSTPFQRAVLRSTARVGFGRVASYGEVARRIGRPGAARAVGNALGRNPVPILIPCHRVLASDGRIGGFTGGLDRKRYLLRHEGRSRRRDGVWGPSRGASA